MNDLFFTQFPSILLKCPMLDSIDREIVLRVLDSKDSSLRISINELIQLLGVSKSNIIRSLAKLKFMGLLKVIKTHNMSGQNSTPIYKFNFNRSYWVLIKDLRILL